MILELFVVLLGLALVLIALGVYIKIEFFSIIGFLFIALLSLFVIMPQYLGIAEYTGSLEYRVGANISVVNSTTMIVDTYATYSDDTTFWIGLLLFFLGLFSAVILWWTRGDRG